MNTNNPLKYLQQNESQIYIIHYSCQTLGDVNEELSPRITSIAALHLQRSNMHSFSIHLVAEIGKVKRDEINKKYDELEAQMLTSFYEFVKNQQDVIWLHWNMSNINYGFEAISHRYKVLTNNNATQISDSKKFNLSALISSMYGNDYVDNPKMQNLMDLNGGRHRDFLSGAEEANAFENKEYIKLHKSTMSKVYWFRDIYHKLQSKKLKTSRTNFWNRVNEILEKPWSKLFGFFATLYALFQFIQAAMAGFPLPK
jgi:hypothetical protein